MLHRTAVSALSILRILIFVSDLSALANRVFVSARSDNDANSCETGMTFLAGSLLSRGNNTVEGNGTDGSFTGTYSAK
jgi:hypothetical protein